MSGEIPSYQLDFRLKAEADFLGALLRYRTVAKNYRLDSDRARILPLITYYQDVIVRTGETDVDSNVKGVLCQVDLALSYSLGSNPLVAGAEAFWEGSVARIGVKHWLLWSFMDPDWWLTSSLNVVEVVSDPVTSNNGRTGNVMHVDVSAQVLLGDLG